MIIDDSADQLHLMLTAVKMVDPQLIVTTAQDGDQALQMLRSDPMQSPKVILLDLRMPGKSGQDVLVELKADPQLRRIPVCVFSNGDLERDIIDSYDGGASFFFKKPSGLEELKAFIGHFRALWFNFASHCAPKA